jgi:hypothetical protein
MSENLRNKLNNQTTDDIEFVYDEQGNLSTIKGTIAFDTFIIPNSPELLSDRGDYSQMKIKGYIGDNGLDYDESRDTDRLVQLWHVSHWTENVDDHGLMVKTPKRAFYLNQQQTGFSFLPSVIFNGKVEGDTVDFRFRRENCLIRYADSKIDLEEHEQSGVTIDVVFSMCLSQTKYRYARFGSFDDVLKQLIPSLIKEVA